MKSFNVYIARERFNLEKERMVSENLDAAHLFEISSILAFKASQDLEYQ